MITTLMTKDNWNLTKNKLKQKWTALTDADLQCTEGGHDALVSRIEQRTCQDRDAIELAIKDCAPAGACATTTAAPFSAAAAADKPAANTGVNFPTPATALGQPSPATTPRAA